MSTGRKGFDPLSSLFDVPSEEEEAEAAGTIPPVAPDQAAEPSHLRRPAGPAEAARLARILAKSKAPEVPSSPPGARGPAPAAKPAGKPAGPDPAALAKALAKAAAAKAGQGKPQPAAAAARVSRLGAAPPPKRALSVEEALAAAREEESRPAAAAAAPAVRPAAAEAAPAEPLDPSRVPDLVLGIVQKAIPALAPLHVHKALVMDDRGVLTAIWKAHRSKFAGAGELDLAVAATRVLWALGTVPIGRLVAAYAVTDKGDYLAWIDLATGSVVAAFADARARFGM